jgi:hypothetical protein
LGLPITVGFLPSVWYGLRCIDIPLWMCQLRNWLDICTDCALVSSRAIHHLVSPMDCGSSAIHPWVETLYTHPTWSPQLVRVFLPRFQSNGVETHQPAFLVG